MMLSIFCADVFAQQANFVYIQADNNYPFYVKLKGKTLKSSSTGYLLIPKITNGTYPLAIGFTAKTEPEQTAKVLIDRNKGFHLKKYGVSGWALLDVETNEMLPLDTVVTVSVNPLNIIPTTIISTDSTTTSIVQNDGDRFSEMLGEVINDPNFIKKDSPVATIPVISTDIRDTVTVTSEIPTSPIVTGETEIITSVITKQFDRTSAEGIERIYLDKHGDITDTIIVFVPVNNETDIYHMVMNNPILPVIKQDTTVTHATPSEPIVISQPEVNKIDSVISPVFPQQPLRDTVLPISSHTAVMINSDCRDNATEADFLKLRKKMVNENTDDDMIRVAKKVFKTKCFTTEFVKNLSVLFLTDAGKYAFFDAAYPFTSDSSNYLQLQSELRDTYYINRFLAMIRK
ncbi:hypothetical protein BH09BAC2_BH09BAC2_16790 [soil metagenome]